MPAQYEVPAAWGASPYTDLDLPSGGKIQAKRLALEDIIAAGLIEEFDALTPTVEEKVVGPAKGKKPADRKAKKPTKAEQAKLDAESGLNFIKNKDTAATLLRVLALMLPQVVIQPKIYPHMEQVDGNWQTIPPAERIDCRVYVDSIPLEDQMHIFGWAMSGLDTEKLQQFREQPESDLGAVESQQSAPVKTEPTASA